MSLETSCPLYYGFWGMVLEILDLSVIITFTLISVQGKVLNKIALSLSLSTFDVMMRKLAEKNKKRFQTGNEKVKGQLLQKKKSEGSVPVKQLFRKLFLDN